MLAELINEILFLFGYVGYSSSFPPPLSAAEERDCVLRMRAGDETARDALIEHNLRLVAHIAKKYTRAGREQDDVISIGTIGLIKAVSSYDPDKGVALSSYASRCVENEILMSIRAEKRIAPSVSFTEPVGTDSDGNDIVLSDVLGTEADSVPDAVSKRLDADTVHARMLTALTPREATVLAMRFGISGQKPMTQREIAKKLAISRSYISRIEKKAMEKLTAALEKEGGQVLY